MLTFISDKTDVFANTYDLPVVFYLWHGVIGELLTVGYEYCNLWTVSHELDCRGGRLCLRSSRFTDPVLERSRTEYEIGQYNITQKFDYIIRR